MRWITSYYHESKHLSESDLASETLNCLWCSSYSLDFLGIVQKKPTVKLFECNECKAVGVSRMPTSDALNRFYESYYNRNKGYTKQHNITFSNPCRMAIHLAGNAHRFTFNTQNTQNCKILDYGGGDGTISFLTAEELIRQKYIKNANICVVDYERSTLQSSNCLIAIKSKNEIALEDKLSYDIVIASAVLEHLPNSPVIIENLLNQVKPGGILYIRTPANKSFIKLWDALGFRWDFTFPAHVYDLGQTFWESYFRHTTRSRFFDLVISRPSILEASFFDSPFRAVLSWLCKLPWYLLRSSWGFVGGWEVVVRRKQTLY